MVLDVDDELYVVNMMLFLGVFGLDLFSDLSFVVWVMDVYRDLINRGVCVVFVWLIEG